MSKFRASSGIALAVTYLAAFPGQSAPMTHGIDLAGTDHSVTPGDKFFASTKRTWIQRTKFPAGKTSFGPGEILVEKTREQLRGLIHDSRTTVSMSRMTDSSGFATAMTPCLSIATAAKRSRSIVTVFY
jgi:predicted metalloendopeptidase